MNRPENDECLKMPPKKRAKTSSDGKFAMRDESLLDQGGRKEKLQLQGEELSYFLKIMSDMRETGSFGEKTLKRLAKIEKEYNEALTLVKQLMITHDESSEIRRKRLVNSFMHRNSLLDEMLAYLIEIRFEHMDKKISKQYYERRSFCPASRQLITLREFREEFVEPVLNYIDRIEHHLTTTFHDAAMYVLYHSEQAHPSLALRSIVRVDQMLEREGAILRNAIRDNLDRMRAARNDFSLYLCELRQVGMKNLGGFYVKDALDWVFKLFQSVFKIKLWMKEVLDNKKNDENSIIYFIYPARKVRRLDRDEQQQQESQHVTNSNDGLAPDNMGNSEPADNIISDRRESQTVYRNATYIEIFLRQ